MQTQNRFFDDLSRLASGALGGLAGLRQEIESRVREQVERMLRNMDVVTREEFEVVRAMAMRARSEQEELAARVETLEAGMRRDRPSEVDEAPAAGPAAGSP